MAQTISIPVRGAVISYLKGIEELLTRLQSVVHDEMVRQASAFQDEDEKQSYLDAAARFRLPYWDIVMPRNDKPTKPPPGQTTVDPAAIWGCPEILKVKSVYVKLPSGDPEKEKNGFWTIDNPLAVFKFPTAAEFHDSESHGVERRRLVMPQESAAQIEALSVFTDWRTGLTKSKQLVFPHPEATMRLTMLLSILSFRGRQYLLLVRSGRC